MYPLYRTTSKEGIFMRYSYEFKMMCVELYHSGSYPDIPERCGRFRPLNTLFWITGCSGICKKIKYDKK